MTPKMQEKHLFEYAVIRVVPRVEREEFINVGVVVYCKKHKYLHTRINLNPDKLQAFYAKIDIDELRENLLAFERICAGEKSGGPIAQLPVADRFRWLTATRSTVVQTSKVHPGLSFDVDQTLEKLFNEQVL